MTVGARLYGASLRIYRRLPTGMRRMVVRRVAPQFTVGAMCLVERRDGRVLLIRQSYRDRWGLPGGLVGRGEPVTDAARRELREEVGFEIELRGEPAVTVDPEPRRVDVIFRARPVRDEDADRATPSSPEIVEVGWFDPVALPELQHETAQALQTLARASYSPPARPMAGER